MKTTYSRYSQHPEHKHKSGNLPSGTLDPMPEPKKAETPQIQVPGIHVNTPAELYPVNDVCMASNNGVIETVFQGMESQGPVRPAVEDRYLVFVIGCVVLYLWSTHAPDRFRVYFDVSFFAACTL